MAVMDVSPYPDSIDSNEYIDSFVKDASVQQENETESWEFRCICGIEGHNYDDGRDMVQCCQCNQWSHCECTHYDVKSNADFFCPWCLSK